MLLFLLCVGLLVAGYFTYGVFIDRLFGPDPSRVTPAVAKADGVDFVPMSTPRIFLIQLLNIAGLGPIFGPILGALYGPAALIWIVIGSIFAGAVHDYFSGMMSVRYGGDSVPNVVGKELGQGFKQFMNYFSVVLLLLVGVVFVLGPGKLLSTMTGIDTNIMVAVIFLYYFLATVLPIDQIIGRLYPFFGALLLFMSVGLLVALGLSTEHSFFASGLTLENTHPKNLPMWPLMFITIACGAISGFHATQSPLMARCIKSEMNGRAVFYGSMIGEGIIALIWATLGLSFYNNAGELQAAIAAGTASGVVDQVSYALLGNVGGVLAVLGVIVLPITSGDTAFRAARLIVAEYINLPQGPIFKRLVIAVPLFVIGFVVSLGDFNIIWRYFGWANQTLAMIVLWAAAAYLARNVKPHWVASVPATFMTAVCTTYILNADIGFRVPMDYSVPAGVVAAVLAAAAFFVFIRRREAMAAAD